METVIRIIRIIIRAVVCVSFAALLVLLVVTLAGAAGRSVFGAPMYAAADLSHLLLVACMPMMAFALMEGRFICVGKFVGLFPKWLNTALEVFMGIASFVFFTIVGYQLFGRIGSSILYGEAFLYTGNPIWPLYGFLGASLLACALATIVYVYERVVRGNAENGS